MNRLIFSALLMVATAILAAPYLQAKIDHEDRTPVKAANAPAQEPKAEPERHGRFRVLADRSGHFMMTAVIKGRRIEVMADTGASTLALRHEDAAKLGIRPRDSDYTVRVRTANGIKHAAEVTLREVRIGSVRVRNVRTLVSPPGAMSVNLLGMSFLGQLSHFNMRGGELVMVQ
ncbi:MAG: TIGR02281 family clan AA aspartic protease [Pseudomonadota bacterium]